ncbi:MAG: hypothetical protein HIU86_11690 [Acidobacteria bacterium]|nr:hypothetical protein [Acidobacteriota bacterium]
MAEPTTPAGEPTGDGGLPAGPSVDEPTTAASRAREKPVLLEPPTDAELAATGEPTLDEVHAAASGTRADAASAGDAEAVRPTGTGTEAARPADTEFVRPATGTVPPESATAVQPVVAEPAPPAPAQAQPVVGPAAESAPPPVRHGNRLVGTAWVLLAAGLFQAVFFGLNALVVLTFVGPAAIASQVQQVAQTALAWLPVLLFFLFFELTVLLFNRAGRFAYVVASLVVGIIVYVGTVLLYSLIVQHTLGDSNTLAQTFLNWEFIIIGLAAREVMLWTGIAIGSRGIRVRRRDSEALKRYDAEVADARD